MGTCRPIHASMWVRIRGCLRVCDVHVCVLCVYLPPSEALVTALQQVLSSSGSRVLEGALPPIAKSSPREALQCPLNFTVHAFLPISYR